MKKEYLNVSGARTYLVVFKKFLQGYNMSICKIKNMNIIPYLESR